MPVVQGEEEGNVQGLKPFGEGECRLRIHIDVEDGAVESHLPGKQRIGVVAVDSPDDRARRMEQPPRLVVEEEAFFQNEQPLARKSFKYAQLDVPSFG